jgi:hypothetical protein
LKEQSTNAEVQAILHALHASNGQMTRAAALLGISRTTLWRKMMKYSLNEGKYPLDSYNTCFLSMTMHAVVVNPTKSVAFLKHHLLQGCRIETVCFNIETFLFSLSFGSRVSTRIFSCHFLAS